MNTPSRHKKGDMNAHSRRVGRCQRKKKTVSRALLSLPKSAAEISSNWKSLSATLSKTSKGKEGKERAFRRKRIPSAKQKDQRECGAKPLEVWFDDVDPALIAQSQGLLPPDRTEPVQTEGSASSSSSSLVTGHDTTAGRYIAMDCEFVGVGVAGKDNALARCSVVNHHGNVLYDKYVKPREAVTDYRTKVSGIRPKHLKNAKEFENVQHEVSKLLRGRVLVGHSIRHDLKVLYLGHPRRLLRDTSTYKPFRELAKGKTPSLKRLSGLLLHTDIQSGEHSSVEDAQAAMKLYRMHRSDWEASMKQLHQRKEKHLHQRKEKQLHQRKEKQLHQRREKRKKDYSWQSTE